MKQSSLMRRIVSTEYLLAAILTAILFVSFAKFEWWWLFALFLVFDLSAIGYLKDRRTGAMTYNIGHSLIGPAIGIVLYACGGPEWLLLISMAWVFHILVDRALGYGMKHTEGFGHTHLGKIGKAKKASKKKK